MMEAQDLTQGVAGRVTFRKRDDGTMDFILPDGGVTTIPDPGVTVAQERRDESSAAAELASLRKRRGNLIEAFEDDGKTWWLLRMNGHQVRQVGILMSRLGDGSLLLTDDDQMVALMMATMQVGVVQGERDPAPYWNPVSYLMEDAYGRLVDTTECEQFVIEPETDNITSLLFDRLTDINPQIWPGKQIAKKKGEAMLNLS